MHSFRVFQNAPLITKPLKLGGCMMKVCGKPNYSYYIIVYPGHLFVFLGNNSILINKMFIKVNAYQIE